MSSACDKECRLIFHMTGGAHRTDCAAYVHSSVVPLFRCRCGSAGKRVGLAWDGKVVGTFSACDACVQKAEATIARVRQIFDAMLASGIGRDLANETMSFLLNHPGFKE